MWRGGLPTRRSRRVAIWAAVVAGVDRRGLARVGDPADGEERRFAGGGAALRVEGVERFLGRLGDLVGAGEEDRRPHRFGHQHRGGDRPGPVFFADHGHRVGSLLGRHRGEGGEGGPGRVGRRRGAPDPDGVVGREARVAERFGALGRGLLRTRLAGGRGGGGRRSFRVVLAAAAPDDRGDDEDESKDDERHQGFRRPWPRRTLGLRFRWFRWRLRLLLGRLDRLFPRRLLAGGDVGVDRPLRDHPGKRTDRSGRGGVEFSTG
jgi:hypothetical protein